MYHVVKSQENTEVLNLNPKTFLQGRNIKKKKVPKIPPYAFCPENLFADLFQVKKA